MGKLWVICCEKLRKIDRVMIVPYCINPFPVAFGALFGVWVLSDVKSVLMQKSVSTLKSVMLCLYVLLCLVVTKKKCKYGEIKLCGKNKKKQKTFSFFCCIDKHLKSITGCKNLWFKTQWLCYSIWGKTPVFHISGFNSETILPISIFFLMIHTCLLPKTVSAFANWSFILGNISYFV